jgi:UDP-N-acetylglucosamine transferase subunit ALG13
VIFVVTGTEIHPFDRLARAADEMQRGGLVGEEVFVQLGSCRYEPRHARFERFLPFGAMSENVRKASVVVTHAGAGSTLLCIQEGRHPIVVPRLPELGEHVDGHQVGFAERLAERGLVTLVRDPDELPAAVAASKAWRATGAPAERGTELVAWLEQFWNERVGGTDRGPVRRIP